MNNSKNTQKDINVLLSANNPQDNVPKGESAEEMKIHELSELYVHEDRFYECSPQTKSTLYRGFYDGYETAQSRIAELEKQNSELEALQKSDEKYIKSLEKQVKQYEEIVDKHIISSANYTAEYVDNLMAKNKKYEEALDGISNTKSFSSHTNYKYDKTIEIAEQALKPKDNEI